MHFAISNSCFVKNMKTANVTDDRWRNGYWPKIRAPKMPLYLIILDGWQDLEDAVIFGDTRALLHKSVYRAN